MEIKPVRLGFAVEFMLDNEQPEDKLDQNFRCSYIGCYSKSKLVGVLSFTETKNSRRIKSIITSKDIPEDDDIVKELLSYAISTDKSVTSFVVPKRVIQFVDAGFNGEGSNKNKVMFMEVKNEKPRL